MSRNRLALITCDAPGCPAESEPRCAPSDARTLARQLGWVCLGRNNANGPADYCPDHTYLAEVDA